MLFLNVQFAGFQTIFGDGDDLTRLNITDKFCAYRCRAQLSDART